MPVTITGEDLKEMVDTEKGREIIKVLSNISPANGMITICVALASMIPFVCDNQDDAAFTLDELGRLMKDLTAKVYEAKASGELRSALQWDDEVWGD